MKKRVGMRCIITSMPEYEPILSLHSRLLLIMVMECEFSIGSVSKQSLLMGYSKLSREEKGLNEFET